MTYNPFEEARKNKRISDLIKENELLKQQLELVYKDKEWMMTKLDVYESHICYLEKIVKENGIEINYPQ